MADEIKPVETPVEEAPAPEAPAPEAPAPEAPKKKPARKAKKKPEPEPEPVKKTFAKPTIHDFQVIIAPHITEKTMALMQNANKVTVKVAANANKIEIKDAFQRIFQVKVIDVKVSNQRSKSTTRGGRYKGKISGFKKALVTIAEGEALDLFRE